MKRGFTLVEMLVVVGIIGILTAILLPVALNAKRSAESAAGMANLRSLGQVMLIYTQNQKDQFLNPFGPNRPSAPGLDPAIAPSTRYPGLGWDFGSNSTGPTRTEAFAYYWYSYLADSDEAPRVREEQFSPGDAWMKSLQKSHASRQETRNGKMLWPSSFLYSPTFWSDSDRYCVLGCRGNVTPESLRTQFVQSVAYPSHKVMLFERMDFEQTNRIQVLGPNQERVGRPPAWNNIRSRTGVLTVDGSGRKIAMADLYSSTTPGGDTGCAIAAPDRPGLIAPMDEQELPTGEGLGSDGLYRAFFWSTPHGIEGRDLPQ